MKKALAVISALDFAFILLLSLSGSFGGALGELLYYLSFATPAVLVLLLRRRLGIEMKPPRVKISGEGLGITLAFAAPSLALVFLVSYLTSLALSHFGGGPVADVSGDLWLVLIKNALAVPLLEEMLFRYIPLSLLSEHSRRGAIIYSAVFFASVHCSLYQLPYAFLAGVIFALLDIMTDSILPSLLLHVANNAISVLWLRYSGDALFSEMYVTVLVSLAAISLPIIYVMRARIKKRILPIMAERGRIAPSLEAAVLVGMTLIISFINL